MRPSQPDERDSAFNLRIRREATDSARFLLPAATLTNVGVTMNARTLEHAVRKLLSSEMTEEHVLGEALRYQGSQVVPTLIKYAERNEYLVETRKDQMRAAMGLQMPASSKSVAWAVSHSPAPSSPTPESLD